MSTDFVTSIVGRGAVDPRQFITSGVAHSGATHLVDLRCWFARIGHTVETCFTVVVVSARLAEPRERVALAELRWIGALAPRPDGTSIIIEALAAGGRLQFANAIETLLNDGRSANHLARSTNVRRVTRLAVIHPIHTDVV